MRSAQEQEPEALGPSRPDVRPLCLGLTARISTRCVCHPDLWPALVLCSRECWPPAHTDGCIPPHEPSTSAFWPQRGGGHSQSPDCGPQNEAEVNGTRGGRFLSPTPCRPRLRASHGARPPPRPVRGGRARRSPSVTRGSCRGRTGDTRMGSAWGTLPGWSPGHGFASEDLGGRACAVLARAAGCTCPAVTQPFGQHSICLVDQLTTAPPPPPPPSPRIIRPGFLMETEPRTTRLGPQGVWAGCLSGELAGQLAERPHPKPPLQVPF